MIDILIPSPTKNIGLISTCIAHLLPTIDLPFKLIVVVDGGVRSDVVDLERLLFNAEHDWGLVQTPSVVGLNRCISAGLEKSANKWIAYVAPWVRMNDPKWLMKMRLVLDRDSAGCMIDTAPDTKSSTAQPVVRKQNRFPLPGCGLAMLKGKFARAHQPTGDVDPVACWAKEAQDRGGRTWHSSGVNYSIVEHEEHIIWRAPSAVQAKSGSR